MASTPRTTDDRGEFRLFWLPPGQYYIRVVPAQTPAYRLTSGAGVARPTFYPGTTDVARAIPIDLKAGTEVAAIDFDLEFATGFSVSGTVTISVQGSDAMPASFYVIPQNALPGEDFDLTGYIWSNSTNPNTAGFELRGNPRGSYYIYPLVTDRTNPATPGATYYSTRIPVEVFDRDVTGLSGDIRHSPDLTVKINMGGSHAYRGRRESTGNYPA